MPENSKTTIKTTLATKSANSKTTPKPPKIAPSPKTLGEKIRLLWLTFFYVGKSPFAPGTCGSLAALPFAIAVCVFLGIETLFLLSVLVFVASIKPIDAFERTAAHDLGLIVIDEVAGVFLSSALIAWAAQGVGSGLGAFGFVLSFFLFRAFDILKPSIIGRVDKKVAGGLGVMGDDMLAGLFAGLLGAMIYGWLWKIGLLSWEWDLMKLRDLF